MGRSRAAFAIIGAVIALIIAASATGLITTPETAIPRADPNALPTPTPTPAPTPSPPKPTATPNGVLDLDFRNGFTYELPGRSPMTVSNGRASVGSGGSTTTLVVQSISDYDVTEDGRLDSIVTLEVTDQQPDASELVTLVVAVYSIDGGVLDLWGTVNLGEADHRRVLQTQASSGLLHVRVAEPLGNVERLSSWRIDRDRKALLLNQPEQFRPASTSPLPTRSYGLRTDHPATVTTLVGSPEPQPARTRFSVDGLMKIWVPEGADSDLIVRVENPASGELVADLLPGSSVQLPGPSSYTTQVISSDGGVTTGEVAVVIGPPDVVDPMISAGGELRAPEWRPEPYLVTLSERGVGEHPWGSSIRDVITTMTTQLGYEPARQPILEEGMVRYRWDSFAVTTLDDSTLHSWEVNSARPPLPIEGFGDPLPWPGFERRPYGLQTTLTPLPAESPDGAGPGTMMWLDSDIIVEWSADVADGETYAPDVRDQRPWSVVRIAAGADFGPVPLSEARVTGVDVNVRRWGSLEAPIVDVAGSSSWYVVLDRVRAEDREWVHIAPRDNGRWSGWMAGEFLADGDTAPSEDGRN